MNDAIREVLKGANDAALRELLYGPDTWAFGVQPLVVRLLAAEEIDNRKETK